MNSIATTYRLKFPAETASGRFTEIRLRGPDAVAFAVLQSLDLGSGGIVKARHARKILEAVGDLPSEALGKLHHHDLAALGILVGTLWERAEMWAALH